MATVLTPFPVGTYTAGVHTLPPTAVPTGIGAAKVLALLGSVTSTTAVITWALELSQDGGSTWTGWGGSGLDLSIAGGIPVQTGLQVVLPNPTNPSRQVRGTLTLSETLIISGTLTLT